MLTVDYDRLDLRPGMTVLDLGCGEGRHAFEAYRRGARVVAVDRGVSEVETTKRWLDAIAAAGEAPAGARYEVVRADLLALPFPDESVDRVIASEVLEHIPDDATALAEIARVLRPGGVFAAFWNDADVRVPWTVRLVEIIDGPDATVRAGRPWDFGRHFGPVAVAEFPHEVWLTLDELLALTTTRSPYLVAGPQGQRDLIDAVRRLAAEAGLPGREGFAMPHVTRVHRATVSQPASG